jgi:hypothetical protein
VNWCAWGLGACLLWLAGPASPFGRLVGAAAAQAPALPLELDWRAPDECPAGAEVRAELERIAHARPGHVLAPLVARAEVRREASRDKPYRLKLHTEHEGQHGERELAAADCRDLVRATTLVLALAFGAGVEIAESEPAPPPPAPPPPPPPPPPPAERSDAPPPEVPRELRAALWLAGGVQLGLLPRAAGLLGVGGSLRLGPASLGLEVQALRAPEERLSGDASVHFDALGGGLRGCLHGALASLDGALCAGGRAAAVRGRSTVQGREDAATAPWGAFTASLALEWPRQHWLRVGLSGGLALSMVRPRFVIAGLEEVHRVPTAVPAASLALILEP